MKYDFDKIIDRSNTEAVKYQMRKPNFKTEDVIPLWVADMDFEGPRPVIDAIKARADHGIFGYNVLTKEYKDAVINWQKRRNNWDLSPELLGTSPGVVPALIPLIEMFSKEGDQILIQPPVYPQFANVIKNCDRRVLNNPLTEVDGLYFVDFEDLEEKLKKQPKLFILCHPHNPVGKVFNHDELKRMGELCVKYKVPLISDEIHSDLTLWGNKHIPMATISEEINDNTITCFSIGKTFNMAGLQFSSIYFNNLKNKEKFESFWNKIHVSSPSTFAQVGAIAAYNEGEDWLEQVKTYIENNIKYVYNYIQENIPAIKVKMPQSTFLMWLDFRGLNLDGEELTQFLIKEAKLGLNAGETFGEGYERFARLNVATPRSILEKAMDQLKNAVDKMNV